MILTEDIENHIFSLPLEERARLADRLLTTLEVIPDASWFADLDSEVDARMKAAQRGEIASIDGDQALENAWNLLRR